MTAAPALLPCPFCGELPSPMSIGLRGGQHYYVQCQNVDCPIVDVSTRRNEGSITTAEEAIERWNRREALLSRAVTTQAGEWRCFHCDEVFTDHAAAMAHFGPSLHSDPACTVDAVKLRDLEQQLERYREEDTDLHREIHRLRSKHLTELRKEEEKGYARGLRDAAVPPSPVMEKSLTLAEEIELAGARGICRLSTC